MWTLYKAVQTVHVLESSTTMEKSSTHFKHEGFHFTCKIVAFYKFFIFSSFFVSVCVSRSDRLEASNLQRSLDNVLERYAFRSFTHPKTGIIYNAQVPHNMSGIQVHAVRLRSGSLRSRGFLYNEFDIPTGVVVKPYVERLVIVYHNFGNWSSHYYSNLETSLGFKLVAPVLGLLAYNSSNVSSANLQEAHILATKKPIKIRFTGIDLPRGGGVTPMCILFYLNGSVSISNMDSPKVCDIYHQGHFSLVVHSLAPTPAPVAESIVSGFVPAPAPSKKVPTSIPYMTSEIPKKKKSNAWKIALWSLLGGFVLVGISGLLGFWLIKHRQKSMITRMEYQADQGEALQTALIGHSRAPAASGLRTLPKLENEYMT